MASTFPEIIIELESSVRKTNELAARAAMAMHEMARDSRRLISESRELLAKVDARLAKFSGMARVNARLIRQAGRPPETAEGFIPAASRDPDPKVDMDSQSASRGYAGRPSRDGGDVK